MRTYRRITYEDRCQLSAFGQKIGYGSTRTLNVAATQDGGTSSRHRDFPLPLTEYIKQ
jgi:hypothetical protein